MHQTAETSVQTWIPCIDRPLHERIAEAVQSRATPISQLLRLMSALDAEGNAHEGLANGNLADENLANENLRIQLRARIGAPLSA